MNLKHLAFSFCLLLACENLLLAEDKTQKNPFITELNVPLDYANATAKDVEDYVNYTISEVTSGITSIHNQQTVTFESVFAALEGINSKISVAYSNCHMLYWVSPDSLIRAKGLEGFQLLDSVSTMIYSDRDIYKKMLGFKSTTAYNELKGNKKILADDMILGFRRTGVNLNDAQLDIFKRLDKEISQLSSAYSENMNTSRDILTLDEEGAKGLPDAFKETYKVAPGKFEIPIINATNETVMANAVSEATRKAYFVKFNNRAADKNLSILDSLVKKRSARQTYGLSNLCDL